VVEFATIIILSVAKIVKNNEEIKDYEKLGYSFGIGIGYWVLVFSVVIPDTQY
jgi:hypothetical protein